MIEVKLDSVRRYRNAQEYRTVPRARIGDAIEVIGDGRIVKQACENAVLAGFDPTEVVRVIRGNGTLCFHEKTLAEFARDGGLRPQDQPDALKKHREGQK